MLPRPSDWSLYVPARHPTPCKSTKSRLPDAEITKGRRSLHLDLLVRTACRHFTKMNSFLVLKPQCFLLIILRIEIGFNSHCGSKDSFSLSGDIGLQAVSIVLAIFLGLGVFLGVLHPEIF